MLKFSKHFDYAFTATQTDMMKQAMHAIIEEKRSDSIGYYSLPIKSLVHLERLKTINTQHIEQIIIIGIGGSSLGIKAIDSILRPYTLNVKEILYLENSDPLTITETLQKIRKNKALFFVISKSGSTIETTSIFKTVIHYCALDLEDKDKERIMIITDKGSALSDFAKHYQLEEFTIPSNVGGRFSVLSAVGIVPLSIAGYDMRRVLQGAKTFMDSFFRNEENHLLEKAVYLYENAEKENTNILFSYADRLEDLTKWYVQLWGESLGKIDLKGKRVGLTPIGLIGAVDQHSFLQLIVEGPRNKNVTFINIEDFQNNLVIPQVSLPGIEKTDFINMQSFNRLINAQCEATMQSVLESGAHADMLTLRKVTPESIGALMTYFELLTSLVGSLFHVNTYDQPGVELGKIILYNNLGNKSN